MYNSLLQMPIQRATITLRKVLREENDIKSTIREEF